MKITPMVTDLVNLLEITREKNSELSRLERNYTPFYLQVPVDKRERCLSARLWKEIYKEELREILINLIQGKNVVVITPPFHRAEFFAATFYNYLNINMYPIRLSRKIRDDYSVYGYITIIVDKIKPSDINEFIKEITSKDSPVILFIEPELWKVLEANINPIVKRDFNNRFKTMVLEFKKVEDLEPQVEATLNKVRSYDLLERILFEESSGEAIDFERIIFDYTAGVISEQFRHLEIPEYVSDYIWAIIDNLSEVVDKTKIPITFIENLWNKLNEVLSLDYKILNMLKLYLTYILKEETHPLISLREIILSRLEKKEFIKARRETLRKAIFAASELWRSLNKEDRNKEPLLLILYILSLRAKIPMINYLNSVKKLFTQEEIDEIIKEKFGKKVSIGEKETDLAKAIVEIIGEDLITSMYETPIEEEFIEVMPEIKLSDVKAYVEGLMRNIQENFKVPRRKDLIYGISLIGSFYDMYSDANSFKKLDELIGSREPTEVMKNYIKDVFITGDYEKCHKIKDLTKEALKDELVSIKDIEVLREYNAIFEKEDFRPGKVLESLGIPSKIGELTISDFFSKILGVENVFKAVIAQLQRKNKLIRLFAKNIQTARAYAGALYEYLYMRGYPVAWINDLAALESVPDNSIIFVDNFDTIQKIIEDLDKKDYIKNKAFIFPIGLTSYWKLKEISNVALVPVREIKEDEIRQILRKKIKISDQEIRNSIDSLYTLLWSTSLYSTIKNKREFLSKIKLYKEKEISEIYKDIETLLKIHPSVKDVFGMIGLLGSVDLDTLVKLYENYFSYYERKYGHAFDFLNLKEILNMVCEGRGRGNELQLYLPRTITRIIKPTPEIINFIIWFIRKQINELKRSLNRKDLDGKTYVIIKEESEEYRQLIKLANFVRNIKSIIHNERRIIGLIEILQDFLLEIPVKDFVTDLIYFEEQDLEEVEINELKERTVEEQLISLKNLVKGVNYDFLNLNLTPISSPKIYNFSSLNLEGTKKICFINNAPNMIFYKGNIITLYDLERKKVSTTKSNYTVDALDCVNNQIFIASTNKIFRLENKKFIETDSIKEFLRIIAFRISPDLKMGLYVVENTKTVCKKEQYQILISNFESSDQHRVIKNITVEPPVKSICWSPDSNQVTISDNNSVFTIFIKEGKIRRYQIREKKPLVNYLYRNLLLIAKARKISLINPKDETRISIITLTNLLDWYKNFMRELDALERALKKIWILDSLCFFNKRLYITGGNRVIEIPFMATFNISARNQSIFSTEVLLPAYPCIEKSRDKIIVKFASPIPKKYITGGKQIKLDFKLNYQPVIPEKDMRCKILLEGNFFKNCKILLRFIDPITKREKPLLFTSNRSREIFLNLKNRLGEILLKGYKDTIKCNVIVV